MNTYDMQPGPPVTPTEPRKWYQIWWEVWRFPDVDTFRMILTEPNATIGRGSLWILVTAFVSAGLSSIASLALINNNIATPIGALSGLICAPLGAVVGAYITTAIYHATSRLFGSNGRFEQLFFCFAAIQAPETVVGMAIYLFYPFFFSAISTGNVTAIGIPLLCLSGFGLLIGLYSLILFVLAVAGAENITIAQAIGAVLLPTIIVVIIFVCLGAGLVTSLTRIYQ
jgi:hypothetical protein